MADDLLIYRMVHVSNLEFIFRNGMWSKNSGVIDPDFVPIGNSDVIKTRIEYNIKVAPPGGMLSDYVPFYFAGHSPMLYNIITGYGDVTRYMQKDIAFIVCGVHRLIDIGAEWCFTDGHAIKAITKYYNSLDDIGKLDWNAIRSTYWNNTETDMDRQRKKMSEFLVRNHVPVETIRFVVVHNEETKAFVESLCEKIGIGLAVIIDVKNRLYYSNYD